MKAIENLLAYYERKRKSAPDARTRRQFEDAKNELAKAIAATRSELEGLRDEMLRIKPEGCGISEDEEWIYEETYFECANLLTEYLEGGNCPKCGGDGLSFIEIDGQPVDGFEDCPMCTEEGGQDA